jgi:DHA1 family bicyclomycin/chloramphenicol resistance-like MFS transporter
MARVVTTFASLFALFAVILFAVVAAGVDSLPVLIALLIVTFACLGLVIPPTMVLALEDHGPIAGLAAALGGTIQMVAGGIMIVLVSLSFDGTALPMVTAIALCAVGALVLSLATLRRRATAPSAAAEAAH